MRNSGAKCRESFGERYGVISVVITEVQWNMTAEHECIATDITSYRSGSDIPAIIAEVLPETGT